jgi:hypothetical protein
MYNTFVQAPAHPAWRPTATPRYTMGQEVPAWNRQPAPRAATLSAAGEVAILDSSMVAVAQDAVGVAATAILGHTFGKSGFHRWSVFFWALAAGLGVKGVLDIVRTKA